MTTNNKTLRNTVLTDEEILYRNQIIADTVYCPITKELLSLKEGEILFCNGKDYFISNKGLEKLESIFGKEFVDERIITYD